MGPRQDARFGRQSRQWSILLLTILSGLAACAGDEPESAPSVEPERPSILFVTLDTTRADRLGFESDRYETPTLDSLAARGVVFEHAYATVPMTLPAHASMFTGRYPSGHGIHENGRYLPGDQTLLAAEMGKRGYATAAFVSGYPLSREFGVARGFDHYDDDFGGSETPASGVERDAAATTERALDYLQRAGDMPVLIWVHYFDPHEPYAPPEPFAARYPDDPYQGEIAFMDGELGRLVSGFEARVEGQESRIVVVGDHGEGLGDHGEALHGKLLYQGVMRVPLVVAGAGIAAGRVDHPVSTRRAFDTILGWADGKESPGWLDGTPEPVLGEALKPYLQYGWQPQIMGLAGRLKVIRSGETEVYDVVSDPGETKNLAGEVELPRDLRRALREYPLPALDETGEGSERALSEEAVRKLASLGYFDSGAGAALRQDAPNPKDMTHIFRDLDVGSALFVDKQYAEAIRMFDRIHEIDPGNLVVTLRLAVAHSVLGNEREAERFFERAREISPASIDLRHYHAMHYYRFDKYDLAVPLFESVLAEMPRRLPALERMARIHQVQGNLEEACGYLERIVALKEEPVAELLQLGSLSMARQDTVVAIGYFERALEYQGDEFDSFLDLGVLYLANRQLGQAASALDRVSPSHPAYALALFKRAQVAVLLNEPDMQERIWRAESEANEMTRDLVANEQLFRGLTRRGSS